MIALIALKLMETGLGPKAAKAAAWAILIALAGALLLIGKCTYDNSVIEKHSAKVEAADAKADAAGTIKAAETKQEITDANERAKAAADQSDDPLRAALDSLRSEAAGSDKATR